MRKRLGLDEDPPAPKLPADDGKVPYRRRDGSTVMVTPARGGRSFLYVYSRSQIGYYDLGRNTANIVALLSGIDAELAATTPTSADPAAPGPALPSPAK